MPEVKVRVTDDALEKIDADALILNWFMEDKGSLPAGWKALDSKLGGDLAATLKGDELQGRALRDRAGAYGGGAEGAPRLPDRRRQPHALRRHAAAPGRRRRRARRAQPRAPSASPLPWPRPAWAPRSARRPSPTAR